MRFLDGTISLYSFERMLILNVFRPFEAARLDAELKLAGEYGLRNKREIWYFFTSIHNF
jgi:hypothetical protein